MIADITLCTLSFNNVQEYSFSLSSQLHRVWGQNERGCVCVWQQRGRMGGTTFFREQRRDSTSPPPSHPSPSHTLFCPIN